LTLQLLRNRFFYTSTYKLTAELKFLLNYTPIMAEEDKPTFWEKIGISKVTVMNFLVNIGAFVLAVAITVGACMYKGFSNDLEKAMCILVSILGCFTAIYSFTIPTPDYYTKSILDIFRFKCKVCLSAAPNLYNIYLDIAVCVQFANEDSKELLYFSIISIVLCRLLCTYWVWKRFHSLPYCFMQFFETFQFREMRRMLESDTIILSGHKLQEITIVCEHIPQYLLQIAFIASEHSNGNTGNAVIYISICLKILTFSVGTKDLDLFMWEQFADQTVDLSTGQPKSKGDKAISHLRVCEAFSSVLTLGIIQYHYSWGVSVPLIFCIFLFTYSLSTGSYTDSDLFVQSFIWVIRSPTLTYDSFKYNWLAKQRREKLLESLEESTKNFYDECNKALIGHWKVHEYVKIMLELYDQYEFVDPAEKLKPNFFGFFEDAVFWDYKFYSVHIFTRSCFNLMWLIIIQIEAQDLNEYIRWAYLGLALAVHMGIAFLLWERIDPQPIQGNALPLHALIEDRLKISPVGTPTPSPTPSPRDSPVQTPNFMEDLDFEPLRGDTPANTPAVRPRQSSAPYPSTPLVDIRPDMLHGNTLTVNQIADTPGMITPSHSLSHSGTHKSMNQGGTTMSVVTKRRDAITMENMVYLGYALNGKNEHGETLLTLAARKNDAEMIRYLISAGFDANEFDSLGQTPLCVSILFQCADAIKEFLPDSGRHNACEVIFPCFPVVDVNLPCTGSYELSPLSCCAARCDIETAKLLRDRGADIDYHALGGNLFHGLFDSQDSADKKLVFLKELVKWIGDGIDINQQINLQRIAEKQKNPDSRHVEYKELTVLWRFIQGWSSIEENEDEDNSKDSSQPEIKIEKKVLTPKELENRKGIQIQFIQMLLEHKADPNHLCLPMHCALSHGNNEIIDLLLKHGADPDQTDENDNTLLTNCLYCDEIRTGISKDIKLVDCVDSLLKAKADLNFEFWDEKISDIVKDTSNPELHKGVQKRILEELGANIQLKDDVLNDTNAQPNDDVPDDTIVQIKDDVPDDTTVQINDDVREDMSTDLKEDDPKRYIEDLSEGANPKNNDSREHSFL